jgi:hypothetical protein
VKGEFEKRIIEESKRPIGSKLDYAWFLMLINEARKEFPLIEEREIPEDCEEALKFMKQRILERKKWFEKYFGDE